MLVPIIDASLSSAFALISKAACFFCSGVSDSNSAPALSASVSKTGSLLGSDGSPDASSESGVIPNFLPR